MRLCALALVQSPAKTLPAVCSGVLGHAGPRGGGLPNVTQVTAAVHDLLWDRACLSLRGRVAVKGKGEMETYVTAPFQPDHSRTKTVLRPRLFHVVQGLTSVRSMYRQSTSSLEPLPQPDT